jgi:hypothetical protein
MRRAAVPSDQSTNDQTGETEMIVNPVTLTMPRHELETLLEAAASCMKRIRTTTTPGYRRYENAYLRLQDCLAAYDKRATADRIRQAEAVSVFTEVRS